MAPDHNDFDRAARASEHVAELRSRASAATIDGIRALETRLQDALDGEPLRGLRNLGKEMPGGARYSFHGARVRGKPDAKLEWGGSKPRHALCLDAAGQLVMVTTGYANGRQAPPAIRPAEGPDFEVGDLEALTRCLDTVLRRHVEASQRAGERYAAALRLAARLREAL